MAEKNNVGKNNAGSTSRNVSPDYGDALAALQGLTNQTSAEPPAEVQAADEQKLQSESRSGSATWSPAMLAQGGVSAASPTGTPVGESGSGAMSVGSKPASPKPTKRPRQEFEELPVAKVLAHKDENTGHVRFKPPPRKRRSTESYKVLVPIMTVLGFLLLVIGMWALAAVCGMSVPGIPGRHQSGYHSSVIKADFLLLALPVSLALLIMAFLMLRQIDKGRQA